MIAWIDLETTGLDPKLNTVIEVACVVTDTDYNEIASFESLVHPRQNKTYSAVALDMHKKSGLWWEVLKCRKGVEEVDDDLNAFMRGAVNSSELPYVLGGQSVHFDRGFMEIWMPYSAKLLTHRQIDVSGLKLFVSNATGIPADDLPPNKSNTTHRAMDDIRASIESVKWYRDFVVEAK